MLRWALQAMRGYRMVICSLKMLYVWGATDGRWGHPTVDRMSERSRRGGRAAAGPGRCCEPGPGMMCGGVYVRDAVCGGVAGMCCVMCWECRVGHGVVWSVCEVGAVEAVPGPCGGCVGVCGAWCTAYVCDPWVCCVMCCGCVVNVWALVCDAGV